jgi:dienelactone hydrolase
MSSADRAVGTGPGGLAAAVVALALVVPLGGCVSVRWAGGAAPTSSPTAVPSSASAAAPPPRPAGSAPTRPFAVGVRHLDLARGPDRPLPTTLWYPRGPGKFPLVLLSHGLTGLPQQFATIGTRWAAAGFVVAAPAYPHTASGVATFDITDVINQPMDASYVLDEVLALDSRPGDPLAGHLDPTAVAAAGHSAGGYTTTALLTSQRDSRLRAAIVLAAGLLGGTYGGAPIPVLFVHGDADQTVSYRDGGRAAYDALPWPKAFLTMRGGDHGGYLTPGNRGFDQVVETTTDFLRWSLYGDPAAGARLRGDGTAPDVSAWEGTLP